MSYSNSDVAHRWANGIGYEEGSNMSCTEKSMLSYSTVIAQCLDREKNLFVVIDKSLTHTTSKHLAYVNRAIPNSATVIYTHISSSSYDNVQFLYSWEKFCKEKRLEMVTHFLKKLFEQYENVTVGNTLASARISRKSLKDIDTLNNLYGDCSLSIWLRNVKTSDRKSKLFKLRKLARLVLDEKSDSEIADSLFGKGTWEAMQNRIAKLKKAQQTRERLDELRRHLFYKPAHSRYSWDDARPSCPYSAKELRKLSAQERVEIRFRNLAIIERENKRRKKFKNWYGPQNEKEASRVRAMKFIGWSKESSYSNEKVVKPNGAIIYDSGKYEGWNSEYSKWIHLNNYWDDTDIKVDYNSFCAAADKYLWRERFWKLCELKMRRRYGAYLFKMKQICEEQNVPFELNEEQNHIYNEFVVRKNRFDADKAAREKAEAERKARELQEKMEKIAVYKEQGVSGIRNLWIERLESVPSDILYSPELCYGGNILMRFAVQSGYIETSKNIRISFADCHRYWAIIKDWHDNRTFTKGVTMAGYNVVSFDNDILVAGCHEIAFCEMQRMYDELCAREQMAA